jgi:hypothetical protein
MVRCGSSCHAFVEHCSPIADDAHCHHHADAEIHAPAAAAQPAATARKNLGVAEHQSARLPGEEWDGIQW